VAFSLYFFPLPLLSQVFFYQLSLCRPFWRLSVFLLVPCFMQASLGQLHALRTLRGHNYFAPSMLRVGHHLPADVCSFVCEADAMSAEASERTIPAGNADVERRREDASARDAQFLGEG
jgi:hypothetical protein